ncbi:hypothetical protein [Actinoplanes sp. M2I2]|uniref:hypothetical protein n=1 Tax=Actinoplanes sp. M2I2 TaxID=1734444 RepID=UPI002020D46C|nr:hypothetical protein [Actinoplanes sp. M2I2]
MTQLDDLKDAMHSPPDFQPVSLDLQQVMAEGGRMRRRRRLAVGSASALTVAALLIGGSQLAGPRDRVGSIPVAGPSAALPSAVSSSAPGVLGTVVSTGRQVGGRQWVLYVQAVDPDDLNGTLTLVLGRTRTGTVDDFTTDIVSSDPGADRMAPGFHAVRPGRLLNGRTTPTFGYYVGDATKITARDAANGKTVEAKRTPWTDFGGPEKAQIFWFDFTEGQPPAGLTDLTAYDDKGARLHVGG